MGNFWIILFKHSSFNCCTFIFVSITPGFLFTNLINTWLLIIGVSISSIIWNHQNWINYWGLLIKKILKKLFHTRHNSWTLDKRTSQFISIMPFKISGEQNVEANLSNSSSLNLFSVSIWGRSFDSKSLWLLSTQNV